MSAATWLKKITPEIFDTLSLSEKGSIPPFPLEAFTAKLKESLHLEDLAIEIGSSDTITGDAFYNGLDTKNIIIPLSLSPLEGNFYFVMGVEDVRALVSSMTKEQSPEKSISVEDESLLKGLYTYFITEAIYAISELNTYENLCLKIRDDSISVHKAYSIDVSIHVKEKILLGRLLLPLPFYEGMHKHFAFIPPTLKNLENIPDVNIPFSVTTGSVELSETELQNLSTGDFVILHNSFYKLSEKKGSFQMLIGEKPLYQVKLQKDGIKILDYLYFYDEEETATMEQDDEELLPPLHGEEQLLDEEQAEEESVAITEETSASKLVEPEKANLSEVPLTVSMEVAKFTLSLEELKKLEPGSKLPININPATVNLVISGRKVGTGEVVEIGDTIGVKILDLYK